MFRNKVVVLEDVDGTSSATGNSEKVFATVVKTILP
jgi:hypothetical protein